MNCEQCERDRRARECLCGNNGYLRPCVQIQPASTLARDRAAHDVYDTEHPAAFALHFLNGSQRIEGLAGLTDGNIQSILLDDRIAVAKLRRRLGMRGNARQRFDELCADTACDGGARTLPATRPESEALRRAIVLLRSD